MDYEYSGYGYRGMDLIPIVKEWGNYYVLDRHVLYYPPDESALRHLLQYYYDESVLILGHRFSDNPLNSVEHLIKEVKVFWLVHQFAWSLPFGKMLDESQEVPEEMLVFFGGKRPNKNELIVIKTIN